MRDCFLVFIVNSTAVISGYCEAALASSLYLDRNWIELKKCFSKTILAAIIDVRVVCWRAPKENHNNNAMIQVLTDLKATKLTLSSYSCTSFQYGCLECTWLKRVQKPFIVEPPSTLEAQTLRFLNPEVANFWLDVKIYLSHHKNIFQSLHLLVATKSKLIWAFLSRSGEGWWAHFHFRPQTSVRKFCPQTSVHKLLSTNFRPQVFLHKLPSTDFRRHLVPHDTHSLLACACMNELKRLVGLLQFNTDDNLIHSYYTVRKWRLNDNHFLGIASRDSKFTPWLDNCLFWSADQNISKSANALNCLPRHP